MGLLSYMEGPFGKAGGIFEKDVVLDERDVRIIKSIPVKSDIFLIENLS